MTLKPVLNQDDATVASQGLYLSLINNRSDKINDPEHRYTVLSGFYKINNLINRRLVREAASKRLVIQ